MRQITTIPTARGPLSAWLLDQLLGEAGASSDELALEGRGLTSDLQLALYLCYEPHYGDLPGVAADAEWNPTIVAFRRRLEAEFERALRELTGPIDASASAGEMIRRIIDEDDGPSVSLHVETSATMADVCEYLVRRSAYQLKEGDPHTFAVPRLRGRSKQLLVEILAGEYGADEPGRMMHSELFATTMHAFGLDDRPNAYIDAQPAGALMISNLVSMFALNRRWRGALIGHLAVYEMTSVAAMTRYSRGLERLGATPEARRFYDVHVLADAEHALMAFDMVEALANEEPALVPDLGFGARCVVEVERLFAEELLTS